MNESPMDFAQAGGTPALPDAPTGGTPALPDATRSPAGVASTPSGGMTPPPFALPAVPPLQPTQPTQPPLATGPEDPQLKERVIMTLQTVFDPEIPVNIYELGMIYEVRADTAGEVAVRMTLTSPACPVAGSLPGEVEQKVSGVLGCTKAKVDLVWEPQWTMAMISEAGKLTLNLPG